MGTHTSDAEYEPPYPRSQVTAHVIVKGFQAGALLGLAFGAPYLRYKGRLTINSAGAASWKTAVGGSVLGGAMATAKLSSVDDTGAFDRAYRLHFNEGQNRVDRITGISSTIGAAAAFATGLPPQYGASLGTVAGIAVHVSTANMFKKNE